MRHLVFILLLVALLFIVLAVAAFNRVPRRTTPSRGIVSPASGRIIKISDVSAPEIVFEKKGVQNSVSIPELAGPVHVIVIEMNLRDVHVQRAPISGFISRMDHYAGHHKNALGRSEDSLVTENEKVVTVFENDQTSIGVVQVAGLAARRIVNRLGVDAVVSEGEVYGRILLGSQVVVVIPQSFTVDVSVGERIVDGETILAH